MGQTLFHSSRSHTNSLLSLNILRTFQNPIYMKSNMQTSTHTHILFPYINVPSVGHTINLLESKDGSSVAIGVLYKTRPLYFQKNTKTTRTEDLKHGTPSQTSHTLKSYKVRAQKNTYSNMLTPLQLVLNNCISVMLNV